ncbi:ArsC family reductase [Pseudacidovorax intermedius]|uniref:ArsC family transcriptional regulator n=1 Tax=Pseudacidovorax intermedius TaxID=433924 RepID=A0A147GM72_9BURK|nr:ArsC family reductase [Pseudacidovorax intermedius]KTT14654.1 ArsC family transcriptional regulator [Pseudacidovorax intermedius]
MIDVYGIPNCDTVKRARTWLDGQGLAYTFHDFKKQGVPDAALARWLAAVGWEPLVNRRGTTWRQLDEAARQAVVDADAAAAALRAHPSLVKRPVVEWADGAVTVGFDAETWKTHAAR